MIMDFPTTPAPAPFNIGPDDTGRPVIVIGPAPYTGEQGPTGILAPARRVVYVTLNLFDGATAPSEVITVETVTAPDGRGTNIVRRTPRGTMAPAIVTEHATAADALSTALSSHGWGPLATTPDGAALVHANDADRADRDPLAV